jgi:hypothetical protein
VKIERWFLSVGKETTKVIRIYVPGFFKLKRIDICKKIMILNKWHRNKE